MIRLLEQRPSRENYGSSKQGEFAFINVNRMILDRSDSTGLRLVPEGHP